MSDVSTWSALDADNNLPPPDGWPEFMMPSAVNNVGRMMMGATRRMYDTLVAGSLVLPYLKLAGGQTVTGPVTFAGITASSITSTGTINAASTISTSGAITASGTVTGGTINGININSTGSITAGNQMFVNAGGLMVWAGDITANTGKVIGNSLELPGGNQRLHLDAAYQYHTYVNNFYWAFDRAAGTLYWAGTNSPNWVMRNTDGFTYNAKANVGGYGDYSNLSDRRFKDAATITTATQGLAEILQLQPVEFQRLPVEGGPPPVWELGFVAQDVAAVLPQAVNIAGVELPDGTGGLESTEPTLGVTSGAIVAALVNALKTIDARLTALEGGV